MYNAVTKNQFYNSGSVCADNYCVSCERVKTKAKKMSAQKRNELEIKLICFLLVAGNILVMKKISPSFDTFFGYFLQATVGISFSLMLLKTLIRKVIKYIK
ncbi:MAG: hypothetical protein II998_11470 [Clostridia bacterium]|nr:hypothetical protein [Clostridia bacterium]